MSVTKASLADAIYESCDLSKKLSMSTIETLLEIMKKTLSSGEAILISGLANFPLKRRKSEEEEIPRPAMT
jgi:integration host factor subunit alpha